MVTKKDERLSFILRYKIDPLFNADDRIGELVEFCKESIIEEDESVYGLANPRMSAQRCADKMLAMTVCKEAEIKVEPLKGLFLLQSR